MLPAAEPDICIRENSFQSGCPIIRAERPFTMEAFIDCEGQIAYECRLTVPGNCTVSDHKQTTAKEGVAETWNVVCRQPGQAEFSLELLVGGNVLQKSTISQIVLPPRKIEKLDYIPDPKPVKTDMLIGVHN